MIVASPLRRALRPAHCLRHSPGERRTGGNSASRRRSLAPQVGVVDHMHVRRAGNPSALAACPNVPIEVTPTAAMRSGSSGSCRIPPYGEAEATVKTGTGRKPHRMFALRTRTMTSPDSCCGGVKGTPRRSMRWSRWSSANSITSRDAAWRGTGGPYAPTHGARQRGVRAARRRAARELAEPCALPGDGRPRHAAGTGR